MRFRSGCCECGQQGTRTRKGANRWRFAAAYCALLGAQLLQLADVAPAVAQSPSHEQREVYIGTFGGPPRAKPDAGGDPRTQPAGEGVSAGDLLAEAMGRLGAGDRAGASRQFEQLVARHPDSREAGHARRYLGEAYRADSGLRPANGDPSGAVRIESVPIEAKAGTAGPQVGEGWRVSIRPETVLEHRLISEVGDRVFFPSGSAELGSRARAVLSAQAAWLKKQPFINAVIEGHADEPGSEVENLVLSQARGEAVRNRLIEEGVPADRISVEARGRAERLAECAEPECAAQNRRALTVPFVRDKDPRNTPLAQRSVGDGARPSSRGTALSAVTAEPGTSAGGSAR